MLCGSVPQGRNNQVENSEQKTTMTINQLTATHIAAAKAAIEEELTGSGRMMVISREANQYVAKILTLADKAIAESGPCDTIGIATNTLGMKLIEMKKPRVIELAKIDNSDVCHRSIGNGSKGCICSLKLGHKGECMFTRSQVKFLTEDKE